MVTQMIRRPGKSTTDATDIYKLNRRIHERVGRAIKEAEGEITMSKSTPRRKLSTDDTMVEITRSIHEKWTYIHYQTHSTGVYVHKVTYTPNQDIPLLDAVESGDVTITYLLSRKDNFGEDTLRNPGRRQSCVATTDPSKEPDLLDFVPLNVAQKLMWIRKPQEEVAAAIIAHMIDVLDMSRSAFYSDSKSKVATTKE